MFKEKKEEELMASNRSISLGSYKMRGVIELLRRFKSSKPSNGSHTAVNVSSDSNAVVAARPMMTGNSKWPMVQLAGVTFLHAASRAKHTAAMGKVGNPIPSSPSPKPSSRSAGRGRFHLWAKFVLGSIFPLLVAFGAPKWTTFLKIGGEVEIALKDAEQVAEVIEKVATVVEKVSEEVAEKLPDDNKIKEAASIVEHFSKEAAKDAHIAEEIMHKIDSVKQELGDVGEMVEPIIEDIAHANNKSQKGDDS